MKTDLRGAEKSGLRRTPNDRQPVFWGAHASGVWGSASRRAEFVSVPPKTEPLAARGSLSFGVRFTNRLALRGGGKIRFKALLKLLAAHVVQGIVSGNRRVPPRNPRGTIILLMSVCRAVAQLGRAPRSGRGGREFESRRPDHFFSSSRMLSGEVRTQFDCSARSAKESGRQPNGRARWGEGYRENLAGPTISFLQVACSPARFERSSTAARGSAKESGRQANGRARWEKGNRDNLAGPTISLSRVSLPSSSNAVSGARRRIRPI